MYIYESKYLRINLSKAEQMFYFEWLSASQDMSSNDYKDAILEYIAKVEEYRPSRMLFDERNMGFSIAPKLQAWIGKSIFPRMIHAGLSKVAIITSNDFYVKLATEQIVGENSQANLLNIQLFEDMPQAKKWLLTH